MAKNLYRTHRLYLTLALLLSFSLFSFAQQSELNFQNDNDLYLLNKQDQYYTNGIFFSIRKTADSALLTSTEANRLWGITVAQQMYNAYTAQIHYIEEVDRPITAYLFLRFNMDRFFANETFVSLIGELGTIGRRALGRQFQEGVHRALNLYEIAGWEYQLNNAVGVNAAVQYGGLLFRNDAQWIDLSAQGRVTLGLNHTDASIASVFRFGRINPLHQSAYTSSRLQARGEAVDNEFFFFYQPQLKLVGYDATLQGGIFLRDKGPVTHTPSRWMSYHQFGFVYAKQALTLRMQYMFYSKEVPGMFFRHRYGSIGAGYRF